MLVCSMRSHLPQGNVLAPCLPEQSVAADPLDASSQVLPFSRSSATDFSVGLKWPTWTVCGPGISAYSAASKRDVARLIDSAIMLAVSRVEMIRDLRSAIRPLRRLDVEWQRASNKPASGSTLL